MALGDAVPEGGTSADDAGTGAVLHIADSNQAAAREAGGGRHGASAAVVQGQVQAGKASAVDVASQTQVCEGKVLHSLPASRELA